MDAEQAQQFLDDCDEIFGFAVRDYGFSPGELERVLGMRGAYVYFMGSEVALRCSWDDFERYFDLEVLRLQDGKRPDGYRDEAARPLSVDFHKVLKHRGKTRQRDMEADLGAPKSRSRKKRQNWFYSMDPRVLWRWELNACAEDLRDSAPDILRNETECFAEGDEEDPWPRAAEPPKRPRLP